MRTLKKTKLAVIVGFLMLASFAAGDMTFYRMPLQGRRSVKLTKEYKLHIGEYFPEAFQLAIYRMQAEPEPVPRDQEEKYLDEAMADVVTYYEKYKVFIYK